MHRAFGMLNLYMFFRNKFRVRREFRSIAGGSLPVIIVPHDTGEHVKNAKAYNGSTKSCNTGGRGL